MALFRPNLDCLVRSRSGANVYGEETLGEARKARCAIVELHMRVVRSSVRADSSASRGSAREHEGEARLLFPTTVELNLDDQVEVAGYQLRVVGIFPRHNLQGVLDHMEVECATWGRP